MDEQLLDELLAMAKRDSETHTHLSSPTGKLLGQLRRGDATSSQGECRTTDELVDTYGWPGIALVWLEVAARPGWWPSMPSALPPCGENSNAVMEQAVESGDVPKQLLACLTNRIQFDESRPQLYGTVLGLERDGRTHGSTRRSGEHQHPEERRSRSPAVRRRFSEAPRRGSRTRGRKSTGDSADHRRKGHKWARRIGWILTEGGELDGYYVTISALNPT